MIVEFAQGLVALALIGALFVTWKFAGNAHDKIDWVQDDVDGQILALSLRQQELEQKVDSLNERVERLAKKERDAALQAKRVRVKKIGGAA